MQLGGIRNPLEAAFIAAAVLVFLAAVLWLLAITLSWASECPGRTLSAGRDGMSLWPPGEGCFAFREGGSDRMLIHEAAPLLKWLVLGLALTAVITVIAGLAASIAALRSRAVER